MSLDKDRLQELLHSGTKENINLAIAMIMQKEKEETEALKKTRKELEKIANNSNVRLYRILITGKLSWYGKPSRFPKALLLLEQLRELEMYDIKGPLPKDIGRLKNLRKLDLGCNDLKHIPESIGELVHLEELDLSGNYIETLPSSIGNLKQLKILRLNENSLTSLPESIGELSNLEELWLFDNQLKTLPESIERLSSLYELRLERNQISKLPESIGGLSQVAYLDLNNNQLENFPNSASQLNLFFLNVANNKLASLSALEGIKASEHLADLIISGNPIPKDDVDKIKEWFSDCEVDY